MPKYNVSVIKHTVYDTYVTSELTLVIEAPDDDSAQAYVQRLIDTEEDVNSNSLVYDNDAAWAEVDDEVGDEEILEIEIDEVELADDDSAQPDAVVAHPITGDNNQCPNST